MSFISARKSKFHSWLDCTKRNMDDAQSDLFTFVSHPQRGQRSRVILGHKDSAKRSLSANSSRVPASVRRVNGLMLDGLSDSLISKNWGPCLLLFCSRQHYLRSNTPFSNLLSNKHHGSCARSSTPVCFQSRWCGRLFFTTRAGPLRSGVEFGWHVSLISSMKNGLESSLDGVEWLIEICWIVSSILTT